MGVSKATCLSQEDASAVSLASTLGRKDFVGIIIEEDDGDGILSSQDVVSYSAVIRDDDKKAFQKLQTCPTKAARFTMTVEEYLKRNSNADIRSLRYAANKEFGTYDLTPEMDDMFTLRSFRGKPEDVDGAKFKDANTSQVAEEMLFYGIMQRTMARLMIELGLPDTKTIWAIGFKFEGPEGRVSEAVFEANSGAFAIDEEQIAKINEELAKVFVGRWMPARLKTEAQTPRYDPAIVRSKARKPLFVSAKPDANMAL